MSDIYVDSSQLPIIKDNNSWTVFMDHAEQQYNDWGVSCRSCYREYYKRILFGLFVCILGIAISLILVLKTTAPTYPCMGYDSNTLASTVSVACLQYTWKQVCPSSSYTFYQGYAGWWNQSPQGATMVRCRGTTVCGVGSYGNILIYMRLCQTNYGSW